MSCLSTFSKGFFLRLLGQFHLNFICSLLVKGKRKFIGHITKMAAMPIDGKDLKNSSSPDTLDQLP